MIRTLMGVGHPALAHTPRELALRRYGRPMHCAASRRRNDLVHQAVPSPPAAGSRKQAQA